MNRFFAVIILLALAITMTAIATSWISTTYHSMMWKPEILKILSIEMYRNETDSSWYLKLEVENDGEGAAEIYKIEIHGIETININPPIKIASGNREQISIKLSKEYTYGTMYTVKLYLKSGTVYPVLEKIIKT